MQIETQHQHGRTLLTIRGELTVHEAVALHRALLEGLGGCSSMDLDLGGVTALDTAGVQQLVVLRREGRAAGKRVRIVEHSAATREVMSLYQLDAFFAEPA